MKILTLDLGKSFGFAQSKGGCVINSGVIKINYHVKSCVGWKFIEFSRLVKLLIVDFKPHEIFYEESYNNVSIKSARAFDGYLAVVQMLACERNIPVEGYHYGTIKKHITGNGHALKKQVIEAVNSKNMVAHTVHDDNEADALALMHFVLNEKIKENG